MSIRYAHNDFCVNNEPIIENVNSAKLQKALQVYNPHYFAMVPKVYDIMAEKISDAIKQKGKLIETLLFSALKLSGYVRNKYGILVGRWVFRPVYKKVFGKNIIGLCTMGTACRKETAELFLNMGLL